MANSQLEFVLKKTQTLIEDTLIITEDLLHIYSIQIQLYLLHSTQQTHQLHSTNKHTYFIPLF